MRGCPICVIGAGGRVVLIKVAKPSLALSVPFLRVPHRIRLI